MRLIDADALLEKLENIDSEGGYDVESINYLITNAPTVQRDGWVSVPIEPTEEMIEASINSKSPWNIIDAYKAMIQAAPTDKE